MFIRLILLILLIYWAVKLFNQLTGPGQNKNEVKGKPEPKKPLDLSDYDVEDADYEDIEK